ncbi:MAG: gliding motility-associated C-terminal domain-containing protein [Bacteroidetes bacterium]|nr:gliding motility-associated C-terminal domain-containing protein [Bacteroidota bacterium]
MIASTGWDSGAFIGHINLIRTDLDGNVLWTKEYSLTNSEDVAGFVIHNDRFYITATGDYNFPAVYPHTVLLCTDSDGNLIFSKRFYAPPYQYSGNKLAISPTGKICIVGSTNSYGPMSPFMHLIVLQCDSMGNLEWAKVQAAPYDNEPSGVQYDNGEWVICGTAAFINTAWDFYLTRYDINGQFKYCKFYDGGTVNGEFSRDMILSDNHSVVIAGDEGTFDERNITLVKIDALGNLIWSRQYQLSVVFTNYPYGVIKTIDEDGYAIISDIRPPAAFRDAGLIRVDDKGNLMCYNAPYALNTRTDSLIHYTATINEVSAPVNVTDITPYYLPYIISEKIRCETPKADFTFTGDTACPQYCLKIKNTSMHALTYQWYFPGGQPDNYWGQQPPEICYDSAGVYTISVMVTNNLTSDSTSRTFSIEPFCKTIFIPNVITPNGDGLNEFFVIKNLPDNFHLQIFNRWGNRVFETTNPKEFWKGEHSGVYYYTLEVMYPSNSKEYHGTVTVMAD